MTDRLEPAPRDDLFAPPEPGTLSRPAPQPQPVPPAHPYAAGPGLVTPVPAVGQQAGTDRPATPEPSAGHSTTEPPGVGDREPAARPPARRPRGGGAALVVAALVAGLVGGVVGDRVSDRVDPDRPSDAALPVSGTQGDGAPAAPSRPAGSFADIAAGVLPSVVSLEVRREEGVSTGSGFVLRADGYILTNNHVVAGAATRGDITVAFADGSEHPAELVGATADYDLAVVRVEARDLTPLVLGDSDEVVVGDAVLAVGAPLGLESTVTAGIVSALHRPVQAGEAAQTAFIDAIQTDAAINPGNSGGPLLNAAGEVVGINSAIAQPPGSMSATGSIGLGFAIPANQARHTAEQLIETGRATYPVIGVLLDSTYRGEGVQVATEAQQGQAPVTPGGPADQAGIRPGDVILAIDGRPVSMSDELIVAIRARQPGDAVTLRVRTGEEERDVRVVLQEQASQ
ncbi:S1C family serine protease [Isoptericola variabilis]|uniref:Peptidase S1 and S6 chymotrypsin/Hap n=1 Tax=Isoptericola variabilis (strain 225) TaxID=743718 RepID=F6FPU8_ISOV2|nr:trypsin-like peptidase domain-containing protein [Isoptericola variabilis]AEG43737.1 peptidase S1 and S6 chymotrypsin/Hap [Isoptericola variabilis 225]TWH27417.1 putative serine protease PepD [Isoptericola variabilis J7]